jgi:hypothetical protein
MCQSWSKTARKWRYVTLGCFVSFTNEYFQLWKRISSPLQIVKASCTLTSHIFLFCMNTVDNNIFTGLCIIMIYAPFFVHLTQKVNTVSYNWHQLLFSLSLTFHMLLLSSETTQALPIGGGNWNTWRKPPTYCKLLTNFLT